MRKTVINNKTKIRFSTILRLLQIYRVIVKYRLTELLPDTPGSKVVQWVGFMVTFSRAVPKEMPRGERLRLALQALGPIFIKFGQMLSTRRDLVPPDIAEMLTKLQDRVEPFEGAPDIISRALRQEIEDVFETFDKTPLASASVAQVHAATLKNGDEVVVKVLRPGIERKIRRDVSLLYVIGAWALRSSEFARRLRPLDVISDYETTLENELNLMLEAANAAQLKRNFLGSELLYVPTVYWEHCRNQIMVMERVYGTPIGDVATLKSQGVDFECLARRGVEIFFTQVFRDNFFHADMHPGNIFVETTDPKKPRYIAVDFGIMGSLSRYDQRYLADNFLAFFKQDYRRVSELHIESGWVPRKTRVEAFESAIRAACEPIFGKPLKDISVAQFLLQLFQTARQFDMELQPQLVLLQKTLFYVEGLGKTLHPELDLWKTAEPIIEKWVREQVSVKTLYRELKQRVPTWLEKMPTIPDLLYLQIQGQANHALDASLPVSQKPVANKVGASARYALRAFFGASACIVSVLGFNASLAMPSTAAFAFLGLGIVLLVRK